MGDNQNVSHQKYRLFDPYFKAWTHVFYIDVGMHIIGNLNRFKAWPYEIGKLYAHSDKYPKHVSATSSSRGSRIFPNWLPPLIWRDHFQTTCLIFETRLIQDDTVQRLKDLMLEYPIAITNEQAIMNILFNGLEDRWARLPIRDDHGLLYDYFARWDPVDSYVMLKIRYNGGV